MDGWMDGWMNKWMEECSLKDLQQCTTKLTADTAWKWTWRTYCLAPQHQESFFWVAGTAKPPQVNLTDTSKGLSKLLSICIPVPTTIDLCSLFGLCSALCWSSCWCCPCCTVLLLLFCVTSNPVQEKDICFEGAVVLLSQGVLGSVRLTEGFKQS